MASKTAGPLSSAIQSVTGDASRRCCRRSATGQTQVGGLAVTPTDIQSAPFVVRIRLDDQDVARRLPAGSTGLAAIFTDHVKAAHLIRRVLLRQTAIINYVNPF
jgi:hypothetical protein